MKVYFVYEKRKGLEPNLYGFTTCEELINRFMEERKMSLFTIKSHKMSKKEFKLFERDHHGIELNAGIFVTSDDNGYKYIRKYIDIVCTNNEEMEAYTAQDIILDGIGRNTCVEARNFNNEILEALHTLCYFQFYNIAYNKNNEYDVFLDGLKNEISMYDFELDAFAIFMKYHGYTMKEK